MIQVHPVDVAADLDPLQSEAADTAFQFLDGQVGRLHGHGAQSGEASRELADHAGEVVVQNAGKIVGVLWLGPIAEQHGHRRQHLD
jgi:hypothetical protein